MRQRATIKEFQIAEIGDRVLAKRYSKTVKGIVTMKHPGALVVDVKGELVVVDADRIIKCFKNN